jgi:uncharacterized protein (DUF736 family)
MEQAKYINSGGLFINDRKEKENHPDYTGKITVDKAGVYYLKGWKRQTKNGQAMLSLACDYAPEDKQVDVSSASVPKTPSVPTNDEAPF